MNDKLGPQAAISKTWLDEHGTDWVFNVTTGHWHYWSGRWRDMDTNRARLYNSVAKLAHTWPVAMHKDSEYRAVMNVVQNQRSVSGSIFDNDVMRVGVPDGEIDLRSGEIEPPNRENWISKSLSTRPASKSADFWLSCLDDWTQGDKDLQFYLQVWCGYCLTGSRREHSILIFDGAGGNGKSTFLQAINHILGDYGYVAPVNLFSGREEHSTGIASLHGKRLTVAHETGGVWKSDLLKQIGSDDEVTARFMHRDNFRFVPQTKLAFVVNDPPIIRSVDDALRRRLKIVPFRFVASPPDLKLSDKISKEYDRILNWMLAGLAVWQVDGLAQYEPNVVKTASKAYLDAEDTLKQYLESCTYADDKDIQFRFVYKDYLAYCEREGVRSKIARNRFAAKLERYGIVSQKRHGNVLWVLQRGLVHSTEYDTTGDPTFSLH